VSLLRWWFFGADGSSEASLVATGLLAVTFQPARERVQRGVNQLLYGDRDDPYLVVRRLTGLLRDTAEPDAVPQLLTEALAASLRLPYVAVETAGRHAPRRLAFHGDQAFDGEVADGVESFDMLAHGEHVGRLIVATRSPGTRFTQAERRLLSDVALHAAVAVETARLIQDLRTSRERLVVAREEERRRLRRDLHDGLGPTIAGMSMQVSAAQRIVGRHERAGTILDELAGDLRTCTVEVRRLVDQLRPPALDRGLPAALRAEGRRFDGEELSVTVDAPDELDGLPAAVEMAAYRIVGEALTNVARHAHATRCTITVELCDALVLTVVDDGVGLPTAGRRGVGLDSMRERAEELGGTCALRSVDPHGTAVEVRMPLRLGVPVS
jgi:two-component system, NarL family, sensor kinase